MFPARRHLKVLRFLTLGKNSNPAKDISHPCFDCQSAKMPLKDLDKLTVVKLRAELIARGLDSKGNKPFLVERLRYAIEQEERSGVAAPEIKMLTSESQLGDTSIEQDPEMEDEPVAESETNQSFNSNSTQLGNGSNGTTEGMYIHFTTLNHSQESM